MKLKKIIHMLCMMVKLSAAGMHAHNLIQEESLQEKIEFPARKTPQYSYTITEKIIPAHGKIVVKSIIITTTPAIFTTGFTRTKVTREPFEHDQIKTTTQTWTTKKYSYATLTTATVITAAIIAIATGLRYFIGQKKLGGQKSKPDNAKIQKWGSITQNSYNFQFSSAIRSNHTNEIEEMIKNQQIDINHVDDRGRTWLFGVRNPKTIDLLIQQGVNINKKDFEGNTPLFFVESKAAVEKLLSIGVDPKTINNLGENALFRQKNPEIIQLLLDKGVDIRQKNVRGQNAMFSSNINTIKLFQEKGFNINEQDTYGNTLLMVQIDNIPFLNKEDNQINSPIEQTIEYLINQDHINLDARNNMNETALHHAISNTNIPVIKALLEKNADITIKNAHGKTAENLVESQFRFDENQAEILDLIEKRKNGIIK